ncbi:MAG TPA: amino acid adenylation domain-containing protein [Thermoanaerobaculia bacterium]|nr:amino acid adenylation domain-containing protein [Thermoanaerobaculia bacterium]
MTDLSSRISALSADKQHLLELLRRKKEGKGTRRPDGQEPLRGPNRLTEPFSLVSAEDRAKLPPDLEDAYPLALLQLGMLYHMELTPDAPVPAYHNVNSFHLIAPLDLAALQEAVQRLVARHPMMRTSFDLTGYSEPLQLVHPTADLPVVYEDLRHLAARERAQALETFILEENRRLVDITRAPLIRYCVHHRTDRSFQFTLTEPHSISDGWSTMSTLSEIFEVYFALLRGETLPDEPPVNGVYRDFVFLERQVLRSEEARRFWQQKLDGWEPPRLPRWSHAEVPDHLDHKPTIFFPVELVEGLERASRSAELPFKTFLLAAHLKVMGLITGREEGSTGINVHGRPEDVDGERARGLFLNSIPMRVPLAGGSWMDLVRRVFQAEMEMFPYRRYPLAVLQQMGGGQELFEVNFTYLQFHQVRKVLEKDKLALGREGNSDLSVTNFAMASTFVRNPLGAAELELTLERNAPGFTLAESCAIFGYYIRAVDGMVNRPDEPHDACWLLSPEEVRQILFEWNDTDKPCPQAPMVHELFALHARRDPQAVAMADAAGRILTYGELEERSNRLARHLRSLGVGPDVLVAVCTERTLLRPVGILGAVKAGGAYVTLDPTYPPERLAFLLEDSRVPVLLTEERFAGALPETAARVICLEDDWAHDGSAAPESGVTPDNLAYVVYTSGSTGKPKGVQIPHAGLMNLVRWHQDLYGVKPGDRGTQIASPAFDASIWELWPYLAGGASLHIPDEETRLSSAGMIRWWAAEGITLAYLMTPLAEGVLAEEIPAGLDLRVRALIIGGDRLHRRPRPEAGFRLMNHYGPAEYTVTSTVVEVPKEGEGGVPGVPSIGRPVDNTQIYILDAQLRPLPIGVAGELYVAGVGLARGYHNRPELTAEKFVPDPFAVSWGEPGARMYRTGDLVRYLPDGDMDFLGRLDHQVKIRGYRIELGEIEAGLTSHPAVREAAVLVHEGAPGDRRLIAYTVPRNGMVDVAALRDHLQRRLPPYMVPSAFISLPSFPLTPNGKLDRKALPMPEEVLPEREYTAPRTPVEALLAGVWEDVLRQGRIGIHDDFFDLGGQSLLATQVVSRVRATLGVELPLRRLFEAPTVAGLAVAVEAARKEGLAAPAPPLVRVPRDLSGEADLPLSFAQQRLWFLHQLDPASPVYNMPLSLRLRGALDVAALGWSLGEVVRRHETLRTTIEMRGGSPVQRIAAPAPLALPTLPTLPVVDLSALPAETGPLLASRLAAREGAAPFDLSRLPVLRLRLFRIAPDDHVLLFAIHHASGDAWSMDVLTREITELYGATVSGRPPRLPGLPLQYADFAVWQRGWLQGEVLAAQVAYWRQALAGAPAALELPTDRPRPPVQTFRGGTVPVALPGAAPAAAALGRREGSTAFMILFAAWAVLLHRYSGQDTVVVGTPIANRNRAEIEGLVGFFVNTLALRADLAALGNEPAFRRLLSRVRETALAAYAHQDLPFEKLVDELHPQRDLSRSPLFQAAFALQNAPAAGVALRVPGLSLEGLPGEDSSAKFDLTLNLQETAAGITGTLEYNRDLFDRPRAERMAAHFAVLAEAALADPERPVSTLPMLTGTEREQILSGWNDTARPCPQVPMVHELFSLHARRDPRAVAMADAEGRSITYGELEARSNRLAWHLGSLGVGPDVLVAVCTERTLLRPVGILGVVKAGGAYVTLDPSYPPERLAFLLEDSRAPVLLTEERFAGSLPETQARVVLLDGDWEGDESTPPESGVTPDNLAYVVYTSGSTGKPKGVEIPHAGLMNLVRWHMDLYEVRPGDRGTQIASPAFDASIWELWPYLASGASLHIPDEETRLSSAGMVRWWAQEGITLAYLMTPLAAGVLEEKIPGNLEVRALIIGGDRLHRGPDPEVGFKLMNHYGPAEYSVTCTVVQVPPQPPEGEESGTPTIGRAIDNTRIYLLDRHGEPVPVGVPGELYVAGLGLARGYHNRPDLTAEKFVPDPFAGESGARMYRTADLVRWLPDGDMDFLGRLDHQVKVRGFRIELGEVEAALGQHPGLREVAVLVREDRPGDRRLAAYAVPDGGAAVSADELRAFLRERLPEYMVPSSFLFLDALPLTANGKVDRCALPAPEWQPETSYVAPRNAAEATLASLFAEVLQVETVGVEDSFFERGGHSLLATRLASRVREAFGVELGVRAVFEAPTVAGLAAAVSGLAGQTAGPVAAIARRPRRTDGPDRFPVSFSQLREWILVQLDPGSSAYNAPGGCRVAGPLSVAALAAAVHEVVRRHEALRTTFVYDGAEPVQVVAPRLTLPVRLTDLTALPDEPREAEARRLAQAELARPFDLARGPLLRVRLVRVAREEHLVLFTVHHIVSDGWSMGIFYRELATLYGAFAAGQPSPLPELPIQYGDFAAWQRETLQGEALEQHLEYWHRQLAGAPSLLRLPTDRPRPPVQTFRGARQPFHLAGEDAAGLRALAGSEAASLFVVLLAGYQTLLGRWSGDEDLSVGTFTGNRWRTELEGLIGFFINSLVLRGDLRGHGGGAPTFRELVRRLREVTLEAYAHGQIPFEKLLDELKLERNLSHTPLFQAMLVLQNYPRPVVRRGDTTITPVEVEVDRANFDLTLWLAEEEGEIAGELEHNLDLFEPATARRFSGQLRNLLRAALADPDRRISELPLLGEAERHQLLVEWNDTAEPGADPLPVHWRFALQADITPQAAALVFDQGRLTYRELHTYVGQLARRLQAQGVGPGSIVGVCLERSPELIVALLGVLETGAAYLPLDPEYPPERLAWMLADSGAAVLLTRERLRGLLPAGEARVVLIEDQAAVPESGPAAFVDADSPAYVMYTSGSTGRPKGVVVRHGSLARYTATARRAYGLVPGDRVLQFASIGFDTSAEEIYPCLTAGATLVLRAGAQPEEAPEFLAGLRRQGVTVVDLPTSYWHELVTALERDPGLAVPQSVRLVILGGERVLAPRVQSWFEKVEEVRLVNTYGPTEGTIVTTHADLSPAAGEPPIGRPVPGARAVVLDRHLQPVPLGVYGELCIGGEGLAQSYLGRPDLTAERFIPYPAGPVGGEPGARLYRTGDLVRHRPDGSLEFGGRVDDQVKVRGVRVEPGEVEAVLASHPAVREAVVAARAGQAGPRLLAWVVPQPGQSPTVSELRGFLRERLPEPMLPAAFVTLEALPLLPNGKVDRRALPEPGNERPTLAAEYAAPEGEMEHAIAGIWRDLLGVDRVGRNDNFFELGGHSLLLVQANQRLREALGREVPVVDLFRFPTVGQLAAHLAGQAEATVSVQKVEEVTGRQRQALARQRQAAARAMQSRKGRA